MQVTMTINEYEANCCLLTETGSKYKRKWNKIKKWKWRGDIRPFTGYGWGSDWLDLTVTKIR